MSRWKGRVLALEALYAWEAAKHPVEELLAFPWVNDQKLKAMSEANLAFSRTLIAGTIENIDAIDQKIRSSIQKWDFSRLKRIDLAILRLSVYSLMFQRNIPSSVTIEEAVKLSLEYSLDDSFRFVNGVLDNISKSCAAEAAAPLHGFEERYAYKVKGSTEDSADGAAEREAGIP